MLRYVSFQQLSQEGTLACSLILDVEGDMRCTSLKNGNYMPNRHVNEHM